jgi:hypothetical protein
MSTFKGTGKTYKEVMDDAQQYLENPPMTMLPGGSWCPFCNTEICRNMRHQKSQTLLLLVSAMARVIEQKDITFKEIIEKVRGEFNDDGTDLVCDMLLQELGK